MTILPFPDPEDRNPRARPSDPNTSHGAGRRRRNWEAIEMTMLRCYLRAAWEARGLADHEVMDECGWGLELDGHRRRCSDLRTPKINDDGVITRPALTRAVLDAEDNPMTIISSYSGRPRGLYTLTEEGIPWLDEHRPTWRVEQS